MTTATLTDLAEHHAKQADLYLRWAHLAAEDGEPSKADAQLALARQHHGWAEELRALVTTLDTHAAALQRPFFARPLNPAHARHA